MRIYLEVSCRVELACSIRWDIDDVNTKHPGADAAVQCLELVLSRRVLVLSVKGTRHTSYQITIKLEAFLVDDAAVGTLFVHSLPLEFSRVKRTEVNGSVRTIGLFLLLNVINSLRLTVLFPLVIV